MGRRKAHPERQKNRFKSKKVYDTMKTGKSESGKGESAVLYVSQYHRNFSNRKEELEYQRALVKKLLQWALSREYGLDLSTLHQERTPEGKPFFTDCPVHFSLSHCRGLVCCALSQSPVGVDGESLRPFTQRLVQRACTAEELAWLCTQPDQNAAFLSLWTLKESVMKLSGQGMTYGFQRASFTFEDGKPHFREPDVRVSQFSLSGGWMVSAVSREETFSELHFADLT